MLILTQKAIPLALKEKDTLSLAIVYYYTAACYSNKGNFANALGFITKSVDLYKKKGNNADIAQSLYLQTGIITNFRPPEEAISAALENIKWLKAHKQSQYLSSMYLLLIQIFERLKDQEGKEVFINEFLNDTKLSENPEDQYIRNHFMADRHSKQGRYAAAWPFLENSLKIAPGIAQISWHTEVLIEAAQNLRKRNMPGKAKPYLWKANRLNENARDIEGLCLVYRELGLNELALKNDTKSIQWMKKAMLMARRSRTTDFILPTLLDLVTVQEQTGHYEEAVKSYREINERKDSLFTKERTKIIADASAQFDFEKKENKIALLDKDARLQHVLAETRKVELAENRQKLYYSLVAVSFLLALLLLVGYFYYKSQRLQNQLSLQKSSLQKQARELEESNGFKDKLFSIISHDLRNPVASLKASLMLLNYDREDEKEVTRFEEQVDFLQYTLDNILYWSLNQQNAIPVTRRVAMLDDIIAEVTESLRGLIVMKHLKLSVIESEATLLADEQLLIIVLRNILHNAIKYTPEYGTIEIISHADQECKQISIRDSGPGFHNTDQTISDSHTRGTGLGLNLSKELMKLNKGALEITNAPGKGTLVILRWITTD